MKMRYAKRSVNCMRLSKPAGHALSTCAAVAILSACNGVGSQVAPPGAMRQSALGSDSGLQKQSNLGARPLSRGAPDAFPGKNGRIAFLYGIANDGGGDVYTMNSDGTRVKRLTHFGPSFKKAAFTGEAWSRDGRRIVFSAGSTTSLVGELWVMDANGKHQHRLFNDPRFSDIFPSFSPDGKRVIFARQDLAYYAIAIYRVNVDGSGLTAITHLRLEFDDLRPEYSPDGTKVEFEAEGRGGFERVIALCNADGSDIRLITPPQRGAWGADWSPDGHRIVFGTYLHTTFGQNEEIWSMNLDDETLARLTKNNFEGQTSYYAQPHDEYPSWSPDGTAIVFARWNGRSTASGLFVMTNRGGQWTEKPLRPQGLPRLSAALNYSRIPALTQAGYLAARSGFKRIEKNGEVPRWGTAPNL